MHSNQKLEILTWDAPENRPSVIRATSLPRPAPMIAAVGFTKKNRLASGNALALISLPLILTHFGHTRATLRTLVTNHNNIAFLNCALLQSFKDEFFFVKDASSTLECKTFLSSDFCNGTL